MENVFPFSGGHREPTAGTGIPLPLAQNNNLPRQRGLAEGLPSGTAHRTGSSEPEAEQVRAFLASGSGAEDHTARPFKAATLPQRDALHLATGYLIGAVMTLLGSMAATDGIAGIEGPLLEGAALGFFAICVPLLMAWAAERWLR